MAVPAEPAGLGALEGRGCLGRPRHLGHLDILREQLDGSRGLLAGVSNLPDVGAQWWDAYVAKLRGIAERSPGGPGATSG